MHPCKLNYTALSQEEQQLFELLGDIAHDLHPDAIACRLKMLIVTTGSEETMPCLWSLNDTMALYSEERGLVPTSFAIRRDTCLRP